MPSEPDRNSTIFIVDDESAVADALSVVVEAMGFSAICFSAATEFIEFIESSDLSGPACVIADIQMPGVSGIGLLQRLVDMGLGIPVILMTGGGGAELQGEAERLGAAAFLEKPFRPDELREIIIAIVQRNADQQIAP